MSSPKPHRLVLAAVLAGALAFPAAAAAGDGNGSKPSQCQGGGAISDHQPYGVGQGRKVG